MTSAVQLLERVVGNVCGDMIEKGVPCVVAWGSTTGLLTYRNCHRQCGTEEGVWA
jgi:hypothetical protein